jgi:AmmeMemoRadiSam system protein A
VDEALNKDLQKYLLELARQAVRNHLEGRSKPKIEKKDKILFEKRGAFVTLTIAGQLRGCIGYPLPVKPLAEAVLDMAVAAAAQDPRFDPLEAGDLDRVHIEISVLSLPRKVKGPEEVEVGKHGIIISKGFNKGLLLPQVPTEYGWDRETYLRSGCLKAGLDPNEWKKGVTIEVFTAQVFSEDKKDKDKEDRRQ